MTYNGSCQGFYVFPECLSIVRGPGGGRLTKRPTIKRLKPEKRSNTGCLKKSQGLGQLHGTALVRTWCSGQGGWSRSRSSRPDSQFWKCFSTLFLATGSQGSRLFSIKIHPPVIYFTPPPCQDSPPYQELIVKWSVVCGMALLLVISSACLGFSFGFVSWGRFLQLWNSVAGARKIGTV